MTLRITFLGLLLAVVGGVGLAVLFAQSKWVEMSFFPFAIVLQVTPIVAIFPLINIYVDNQTAKLLLCAWIVAFFPILSNTTLGLNSVDRNLHRPVQAQWRDALAAALASRLPAAMPYFLGGLKIAGGLSLIGAVVAEFVAGAAGQSSGLASRIIEAGYRLNAPRLFAALILISLHRHPDLPGAVAGLASHPAALARKRAEAGAVRCCDSCECASRRPSPLPAISPQGRGESQRCRSAFANLQIAELVEAANLPPCGGDGRQAE